MWLEAISQPAPDASGCPTCGGPVCRRPYGEMYAGAFILDGERVEIRRVPDPCYIDPVVLDPLTQYFNGKLYRLWPGERYHGQSGKRLHRAAWESAFGPIPRGCHIHHRDEDTTNNRLSNLECLPPSEHLAKPSKNRRSPPKGVDPFSDDYRRLALQFNQSEAGRLWHKRNSERMQNWKKWKREPRICGHCEQTYQAVIRKNGHPQIYCSALCRVAAYRVRDAAKRNG